MRKSPTRAHRLALIETEAVSLLISQSLDAPSVRGDQAWRERADLEILLASHRSDGRNHEPLALRR
jgi:hypothetical protein